MNFMEKNKMKLDIYFTTKCFLIFIIIIDSINQIKSLKSRAFTNNQIKIQNQNLFSAVDLIDLFQQQQQIENNYTKTREPINIKEEKENLNQNQFNKDDNSIINNNKTRNSINENMTEKFLNDIKEIISIMKSYRSYIEAALENIKYKKIGPKEDIIFQSIDNKKMNLIQEKSNFNLYFN
jgi:hypothetical protein